MSEMMTIDRSDASGPDESAPVDPARPRLPGLDCGLCGVRTCEEMSGRLEGHPEWLERCIHLSAERVAPPHVGRQGDAAGFRPGGAWRDTLGREFDFYLEHFPEDPGPREVILPHNPLLTRELELRRGDTLIGRPLGMSCGCPITHCGVVRDVDPRTGVVVWCVTGPLAPRASGFKDIGYYVAEAYEGLITESRAEIRIGARYFFQPRMCMLQWRHSGLVNYLSRTKSGLQVRVEGLWIG